jgi:serine-type D-Ala-D-Ala carboxypeptidase (penicillin-binding protein 5/6)
VNPEAPAPPFMVAPFRLDSLRESSPAPPVPPVPPAPEHGKHSVHSHKRRRRGWRRAFLLAFLLLLAAAAFVGVRLATPEPAPVVTPALGRTVHIPSRSVTLPWPTTGQGAIAIPALGVNVASGPENAVPAASLTKLMTAYVVLHDHPVALGQPGATITVSQADVDDYNSATVNDDSNAAVTLNEQISEADVLGGLLVHSADNYADLLATWDAGTMPAFVAKMNDAAARLGLDHSHFADASGVDPGSESTASDLLKVAALDMANPTFASMVKMSSVTLPVAGTISTYTPLLGVQGVIGVKSGFTTAAGGGDVLAVERTVHGRPVLLLAAVTGQTGPQVLAQAGLHALELVDAVAPLIGSTQVLAGNTVVAHVSESGTRLAATTSSSASLLTWPGVTATRVLVPARHIAKQPRRGAQVGTAVVTLGTQRIAVAVRLTGDIPPPSLLRRILGVRLA